MAVNAGHREAVAGFATTAQNKEMSIIYTK